MNLSWIKGLTFNEKHSLIDFDLTIQSIKIEPPVPQVQKETVPFMNGSYDFSTVGSNGEPVFGDRNVTVKFGITARNEEELYIKYSNILTWLMGTAEKQKIMFDDISNYYFFGKVESVPSFESVRRFGTLEVVFVCDPYKYSIDQFGDDIWDDFCFLTDYTAYTNIFAISGTTTVSVGNSGRSITPLINCSSAMTLNFNNATYSLVQGDNTIWGVKLLNGENNLVFTGNGTVKIIFRAEVL